MKEKLGAKEIVFTKSTKLPCVASDWQNEKNNRGNFFICTARCCRIYCVINRLHWVSKEKANIEVHELKYFYSVEC